ncbi:MAG: threonine/serine dehydratase [Alphaproteobacteria bacterium]|nr:threonine/serine dehydratase [Alphaproteobacteria bacterium]
MLESKYIHKANSRIQEFVRKTPVMMLPAGGFLPNNSVVLKLEHLQHTASFKVRGAFNAMLSLPVPESGVIAASGGNHGAAVAYAANQLGHRAEIFVPEIISPSKLARLKSYDAVVQVGGRDFADALAACQKRQQETGALLLHAYDQPEILAGQGTVALEFEEQAPKLDTVLVAVGGGGLIGGMASWYQGRTRVIAIESTGTPTLYQARAQGAPCDVTVSGLAADALGARRIGALGFEAAQAYVAQSLLVSDEQIVAAQRMLWDQFRLILEPGGATAMAALIAGVYQPTAGEAVGVLLCGGNTDPSTVTGNTL